jgi:hypothetical protein
MLTTYAAKYLPRMGLNPVRVVVCASTPCENKFSLRDGFAVDAMVDERRTIAFFCSARCFLNEIPLSCCASV